MISIPRAINPVRKQVSELEPLLHNKPTLENELHIRGPMFIMLSLDYFFHLHVSVSLLPSPSSSTP